MDEDNKPQYGTADIVGSYRRAEDIVNQRLGHMLIFVGLVFVGATSIDDSLGQVVLLCWGTVICGILTKAIWRAHRKYAHTRGTLKPLDHPSKDADIELDRDRWSILRFWEVGRTVRLIGLWLPGIVTLSLAYCAVAATVGLPPFRETPAIKTCCCHYHSPDIDTSVNRTPNVEKAD